MGQLTLGMGLIDYSTMELVHAYGGGVNSVAAAVWLHEHGYIPRAIVMVDPGSEWKHTIEYRENVFNPWCDEVGFPRVTVVTRMEEGQHVKRAWRLETLHDECVRIKSVPSIAYGFKKCSQKHKGDTSRWWIARQDWALAEWEAGRKIAKVIGYDADEPYRVRDAFQNPWEAARLVPFYPLYNDGLGRDECIDLIKRGGLPIPGKSACTFCPSNTIAEWKLLRRVEPEAFAAAVAMSRNAEIESPDVVGLMRCNPHGQRQLHAWADGEYGEIDDDAMENPPPCDCAL